MPVLHPADTGSHLSTNGKCLAVILVPAAYVITVIGTIRLLATQTAINK